MRALPRSAAGAAQRFSAVSPRSLLPRQSGRRSDAAPQRRKTPIAVFTAARASDDDEDEIEDEELRRRPPGHPLAFGDSSPTSTSSSAAPLSWPSLDLASVAAALARSHEAKNGGGEKGKNSKKSSRLPGGVHLVGTGPGDAGLLTLRAVALLASADVVLYDRLVSPEILALVNPGARMVYVGKSKGLHTRSQEEIHDLLVAFASEEEEGEEAAEEEKQEESDAGDHKSSGNTTTTTKRQRLHPIVLRLKGGDPLVFGRGGEEATALREAGIPVHTVPGISAAGGVAASLGIPLTHRGVATSVRLLTGHARPGGELGLTEDIERVARSPDCENTTLVIYMGLSTLAETSRHLVACGMKASTPAVAVERGTTARQRSVWASVEDLPREVEAAGLVSPTLIIIGGVVALSPGWEEAFGGGGGSLAADSEEDAVVSSSASASFSATDLAAAAS
jgi:siroheme synthase